MSLAMKNTGRNGTRKYGQRIDCDDIKERRLSSVRLQSMIDTTTDVEILCLSKVLPGLITEGRRQFHADNAYPDLRINAALSSFSPTSCTDFPSFSYFSITR